MTKTIIPQGTGLFGDGDGGTTGVSRQITSPTAVEIRSQQNSGISRVSQGRGGPLHVSEGSEKGGAVRDVVDGCRLYTKLGHRHWNLTVGVAHVCLSNYVVDVLGDVLGDGMELRCELGNIINIVLTDGALRRT